MKVMVTGTFDVLHEGHLNFFQQAKALGNELIVLVARDSTVEIVKGRKPLHDEKQRLKDVKNAKIVDKAILGHEDDKYKAIEDEKPNILCLGYDQITFTKKLKESLLKRNLDIEIKRLKPFEPETYKSSIIKEKIKNQAV